MAGRAVRPARTALAAATKVRCWTRGAANWRAIGDRRVLEKVREAILCVSGGTKGLWEEGGREREVKRGGMMSGEERNLEEREGGRKNQILDTRGKESRDL